VRLNLTKPVARKVSVLAVRHDRPSQHRGTVASWFQRSARNGG